MVASSPSRPEDVEVNALRIPPHSIQAEQLVLGALLVDPETLEHVGDILSEDDFYRKDHQLIFKGIHALNEQGGNCDVVAVATWLEDHAQLEEAGGLIYIATLAEDTPAVCNAAAHAEIVHKRSILRRLIQVLNKTGDLVYKPEGRSCQEILDFAEQSVFEIAEKEVNRQKQYVPIRSLLTETMDQIDKLHQGGNPITGIPTGYDDLDMHTAGLQNSDLIIIAGRPSMGKTALAINIAEHAAIKEHKSIAVFSMEMPGPQLVMRMMASLGRIDQHRIRTGRLEDADWPRITSATDMLHETGIYIDDTPALTPGELRARCRRLFREHTLDLIIIDYLQLMQVQGTKENRATEISEISRGLKAMAKELAVPVVALSQLNRSLEQRPNKRPVMSDLRESGAIEQDADVILFIYRDEVYNEESKDKGIAEIIIGKQRNGPIGTIKLTFLGRYTRFENHSQDYNDGYPRSTGAGLESNI